jgi:hypothetical protein
MRRPFGVGGGGGVTRIPTFLRVVHVQRSGGVGPKASEGEVGSVGVTNVAVQLRQHVLHNLSACLQL